MDEMMQWQRRFVSALKDEESAFDVEYPNGFSVYRNNRLFSMQNVMKSVYPAVFAFVGENCFLALIKAHLAEVPQKDGDIGEYGDHFDCTIRKSGILDTLPYLAELAQWEWQWDSLTRHPLAANWTVKALQETVITTHFTHQITTLWQWHCASQTAPPSNWQTPEIVHFFNDPQQRHYVSLSEHTVKTLPDILNAWCDQQLAT